jgi:hypothetical protein
VTDIYPCSYPRLAGIGDIPRLVPSDTTHYSWPPPGVEVIPVAHPESWVLVCGTPTVGGADDIWVTDIAHASGLSGAPLLELVAQLTSRMSPVIRAGVAAGHLYPVIYSPLEGRLLKWIRTTFRGELGGGVEQFQWKVDWGTPGSDPTLDEAWAQAFADSAASIFAAAWVASLGVLGSIAALAATDVKYTEVGCVPWTQNVADGSDGTGGDAAQDFATAWHAYPTATRPAGTGGVALPYEVALAVTLQTDTRGPRGRGRLYLPPFGVNSMITGGIFNTTTVSASGEFIQKLFDDMKSAHSGIVPVVVSQRAKQLHEVTSIQTGRVPDSQRRRRRSQDEAPTVQWVHA